MTVSCVIPARGGSKGIENKNIISFCGKPLLAWSIEVALAAKCVDKVYISTNCKDIAKIAEAYGAFVIERPVSLSGDAASSESAIVHAIESQNKEPMQEDILFLQNTSPLRFDGDIDRAYEVYLREKADSLFSCSPVHDTIWGYIGNELQSLTYDYKNRKPRQASRPKYIENGSIYFFKKQGFLKENNRLFGKIAFYEMPRWQSFEIDTKDDLELCEYYMANKILTVQEKVGKE